MKRNKLFKILLLLTVGLFLSPSVFAQTIAIKGIVKDATGEPIIGANVLQKGTTNGTITDFDGIFELTTPEGATLSVSFIGYESQELPAKSSMNIILKDDSELLQDVVVIGYGSVRKNDLTGSVTAIKPDEMNRGLSTNAQDLMQGKIAGVNVVGDGGAPGSGATIRIRGGSSLNASNNPLIVIDGFAMDDKGVQGLSNPLSMVNPNDIESFTVLKDASATAIYGSRASNGVIIITTKKGSKDGKVRISYNGNVSVSMKKGTLDVMNGDEYRDFVANLFGKDSDTYKKLGTANTNWQDQVYREALGTDHNLTAAGNIAGIPFRASMGYTNQNGIIKTSNFERYTASISLTPTFFDDHLKVNANLKGMISNSRFADTGVLGAAMSFDPTQSIYYQSEDQALMDKYNTSFGGYFQWTGTNNFNDDSWPLAPNSLAQKNPVSTLDYQNNRATSKTLVGNLELDYKFHFLPEMRFHVNGGMDLSTGKQKNEIDPRSASNNYFGYSGLDKTDKYNLLFNSYLQYGKEFSSQFLDVMGGYEWQHFYRKGSNVGSGLYQMTNKNEEEKGKPYNLTNRQWANESFLVSFFGRVNYSVLDRYMLTATLRMDGSSKFNKQNRWGYFPSVALAWKISEENWLKDVDWLSDWKLRVGWGITGQQEGIGEYSYFTSYMGNREHGFYPIIDDGATSRPNAFNSNLTWEKTATWNAGFDFGFMNGRFNSSIDVYKRKTVDLLQNVGVSAGSNFSNVVMSNVGSLENQGVEFSIGGKVIQQKDLVWDLNYNVTWNTNKITELTTGDKEGYYISTGGISAGTGNTVQAHAVGQAASSFYVYQQVYDEHGQPIENTFVDRNGDGVINDSDRYFYKKPAADVTMGLSSKLMWKKWDLGFSLRASLNNYVYNDVESNNSNQNPSAVYSQSGFFSNFVKRHLDKNFQGLGNYYMSDYFVQNASFLRCDNITLGYSFQNFFKLPVSGRVYGTVQNVFTITKYKGLDPEVNGGIDNNIYPRPFVSMVGLSLNF
ncbi:MAG: SusC/RagA family TonB-linked outer membrane protein [Phocaeicola sp.]